ncbi:MAG: hypothetical protein GY805_39610 [Chloroflexi bacterium]|nr:hypothetical protein [Chloroflexota bacterium]
MSSQIKQAIAHIKSGNKKAGKAILMRLLKENPANSNAWLTMSAVVSTTKMRRDCLQKAIHHDPNNKTAHKALAKLNEKYPPPTVMETAVVFEDENEDEEAWLPESFKNNPPPPPPDVETAVILENEDKDEEAWLPQSFILPPPTPPQPAVKNKFSLDNLQQENHLKTIITRRLGKYHQPKNIAKELAEKGIDYNHALKLISYVGKTKKRQIALHRMPIVLLMGIPTLLFGIIILLFSSRYFIFGLAMVVSSIVATVTTLKDILARSE